MYNVSLRFLLQQEAHQRKCRVRTFGVRFLLPQEAHQRKGRIRTFGVRFLLPQEAHQRKGRVRTFGVRFLLPQEAHQRKCRIRTLCFSSIFNLHVLYFLQTNSIITKIIHYRTVKLLILVSIDQFTSHWYQLGVQ
jgi:hypothetical protein